MTLARALCGLFAALFVASCTTDFDLNSLPLRRTDGGNDAGDATGGDATGDGAAGCGVGESRCGRDCVALRSDVDNCGACGNECTANVPHGAPVCVRGACSIRCDAGWGNCDGEAANGCETDTTTSSEHCGGCGMACAAGPNATTACVGGRCALRCAMGFADCDSNPTTGCEVDTQNDVAHCGTCPTACPGATNAAPTCAAGRCGIECAPGFGNCNGMTSDGCETALNSPLNCGSCGMLCTGSNTLCSFSGGRGMCTALCPGSTPTQCPGMAICVNTQTDPNHCGACGTRCMGGANAAPACANGMCTIECTGGFGDCDMNRGTGCEVNLTTSPAHCGGCGMACPAAANAAPTCSVRGGERRCGFTCNTGFADCNATPGDGCEADLQSNPMHCGACGRACPAGATCVAGACACDNGGTPCGGMCCPTGASCGAGGACQCPAAAPTVCAGACVDLNTDPAHCSACGMRCTVGPGGVDDVVACCTAGRCTVEQHRCPSGVGR